MTSAQLFPSGSGRIASVAGATLAVIIMTAGCSLRRQLVEPRELWSPFDRGQLWAVAPFLNESGTSVVDGVRVADLFTQELEQVYGINTVPVNRVLLAMRVNEIRAVATPEEALTLIRALDVDALVVGTVTAYDPYPPPTMGASVQLFTGVLRHRADRLDPQALSRAARGGKTPHTDRATPLAEAAGVFDSRNHGTLSLLGAYARGRTEPDGAFGADIYLMDMELYTQFVSYRLIESLLGFAQARAQPVDNEAIPR